MGRLAFLGQDAGGQGDDGQRRQPGIAAYLAGRGQTVHDRHLDIHEHHVDIARPVPQLPQRRFAIGGQADRGAEIRQRPFDHAQVDGVVVHGQDAQTRQGKRCRRGRLGAGREGWSRRFSLQGQFEPEGAALAGQAVGADLAAHLLDQMLADGESEAGAAKAAGDAGIPLVEGLKKLAQHIGSDADAGVANDEAQPHGALAGGHGRHGQVDFALLGELDGVADKVDQDLLDPMVIAPQHAQWLRRAPHHEVQALGLGEVAHQALDPVQQRVQAEGLLVDDQFTGLDLGQVENVIDDVQQIAASLAHHADHGTLILGERLVFQQLGETENGVHGRAQFVAHVGQEPGLRLARGFGGLAGFDQRGFRLLAFGDVQLGGHIGDHPAIGLVQGRDAGPFDILTAVLAPVDELALPGLASSQRVPEVVKRTLRGFARVQDPGILADRLLPGIAGVANESLVHVLDAGIQAGNGDALHRLLDGQGQALQLPLQIPALGDVPGQHDQLGVIRVGVLHPGDRQFIPGLAPGHGQGIGGAPVAARGGGSYQGRHDGIGSGLGQNLLDLFPHEGLGADI